MARRSILSSFRDQQMPNAAAAEPVSEPKKRSREAKLHIGGYFDPTDQTIVAFQKLKVDLRMSQQEMLLEALRDFVAKQKSAMAFR